MPTTLDQSHRIHIAANDPAFAAKREAAVALICAAIDDTVTPLGYARKGTTWLRQTPHGRTAIHLQRSRYGFTADIHLRFLAPDGTIPQTGIWALEDEVGIRHFCLPHEFTKGEDGVITYLDVYETPGTLDHPIHILKTRALPWLDAHHAAAGLPKIEDYLPR